MREWKNLTNGFRCKGSKMKNGEDSILYKRTLGIWMLVVLYRIRTLCLLNEYDNKENNDISLDDYTIKVVEKKI